MGITQGDLPDRDRRLGEIVFACLQALERGESLDLAGVQARHPEFAAELAEFFADQAQLQQLAAPLRQAAAPEVTVDQDPIRDRDEEGLPPPAPGAAVRYFGDYVLLRKLGQGGMGVVFRARQQSLNRLVAVKMIRAGLLAAGSDRQRFQLEAEAVANLDHPHIVPIYEHGEHDGHLYFSMKLIAGGSLHERRADYAADPRAAARLMASVARAIHHAHQRGILHRDLKPANILLDAAGEPHVTDFGLAKRLEGDSNLTQSDAIVGTPSYMAPEQASGRKGGVTTATDVYGLGAVLYVLLAGRPPFQGDSVLETLQQVREREPEPPSGGGRRVDRDLEVICLKCLRKEPPRRYGSAEALAQDLERWLAGEPIRARRAGVAERAWKWIRRRPTAAALIVVGVVATAGSVALGVRDLRRSREAIQAVTKERNDAEGARRNAVRAGQLAKNEATENLRRLVRMDVANGMRLVEADNPLLALPWFVHALAIDLDGPAAQQRQRIRLAAVLAQCPQFVQLWTEPRSSYLRRLMLAFSPDGRRILYHYDEDGGVIVRDMATGAPSFPPLPPAKVALFSPDGRRILTLATSEVRIWDASDGSMTIPPLRAGRHRRFNHTAFSPDGRRFVTSTEPFDNDHHKVQEERGDEGEAVLRDATTGEPVAPPLKRDGRVVNSRFSPDGRLLVTVMHVETRGQDGRTTSSASELHLWDADAGTLRRRSGRLPNQSLSEVEFTPDGRRLLSRGGEVRIWDTETLRTVLPPEGETFSGAAFSPGGDRVVAHSGTKARVYDAATGKPIGPPFDHGSIISVCSFSPNGSLIVTSGGRSDFTSSGYDAIRIWTAPYGGEMPPPLERSTFLAFSPDGESLLVRGADGAPRIWATRGRPKEGHAVRDPITPPLAAAGWSPTFMFAPSFEGGATIRLTALFSPDGQHLLVASENSLEGVTEFRVWRLRGASSLQGSGRSAGPRPLHSVPDDRPWTSAAGSAVPIEFRTQLSPDARHCVLASQPPSWAQAYFGAGRDGKPVFEPPRPATLVRVLDVETEKLIDNRLTFDAKSYSFLFSEDGGRLVVIRADVSTFILLDPKATFTFQVFDVATLKPVGVAFSIPGPLDCVGVSSDGRALAVGQGRLVTNNIGNQDRLLTIQAWDVATGRPIGQPCRITDPSHGFTSLKALTFSPDGRHLLAEPGQLTAFNAEHPQPLILDVGTGRWFSIRREVKHKSAITLPMYWVEGYVGFGPAPYGDRLSVFSPDGRRVLVADGGNRAQLFDAVTGAPLVPPLEHPGRINWVAFSPDGRRVATAGSDGTARLWAAATGVPVGSPLRHASSVIHVAFSPENDLLSSVARSTVPPDHAGGGMTVSIWDAVTGEPLTLPVIPGPQVTDLAFAAGRPRVVLTLKYGMDPLVWEIPIEDRSVADLTALATVLSAHHIDAGGTLAPAPMAAIVDACDRLAVSDPAHFGALRHASDARPAGVHNEP